MGSPPMRIDPRLKDYATPRQKEVLEAIEVHGSASAAARALGLHLSGVARLPEKVARRAAREGYAPGHFQHGVAAGYLMGKVTVQRGPGGDVERTWERQSPEDQHRWETMQAHIDGAKDEILPTPALLPPQRCDQDLLTVYPVGDPHAGMYSWRDETGAHFNLAEFERIQCAAIDRLVASTPPSALAIFNDKGDSTHADNSKNRTPKSGHELHGHARHAEVVRTSIKVKRYQIARLLQKHEKVIVRVDPGNHDPETAMHQALVLEALYENEPRVEVITSPNPYWYYIFGTTLIGTCHGDGAKGKDLPGVMANDVRSLWGQADYCVWFVGHLHHKDIKEYTGCTVEYLGTLAAPDHHSHHAGYRSRRTLEAVTFHREDAEVERHTCSLKRIERLTAEVRAA